MAAADTARLIASLELDSRKFQAGTAAALGSLGKLEGRFGNLGTNVKRGVNNAAANVAKIGAVAVGGLTVAITQGIDSLSQLEDATTAVDGAIKQTGQAGKVTSGQVAQWANEIEASVQAAFDDKDITRNAATLLRYGRVTAANLRPALVVMTDLAAKTGSVDSAASLLARALADPEKAAGKLAKAGVVLTKQQQDQIKKLVAAGKIEQAQAILIGDLGKATKNAARDSKGAFGDMQNTLRDTVEDAERLLAVGAQPVLLKLGQRITDALANPSTMNDIKNLGAAAADFLDKAIDFAGRIPWGTIKQALVIGGQGAQAILGAFTSMPDWVQTAVISGWGLNKLTGGAFADIVGDLGKGLVKGVLGMTAAVVNIKAGVVNGGGGGGVPGGAGAAAGGAAGAAEGIAPALAPMSAAAFLSSAAFGAGLLAIGDRVTKGVEDAIASALPPALQPIVSQAGQSSRSQAFGGVEGALNFASDPGGAISQMTDAVNQLSTFINSPHPDFLGDLTKLGFLQYHPPATAANPNDGSFSRDMDKNLASSASVLKNLQSIGIKIPPSLDRMRDKLGTLLDKLHAANKAGRTGEASDLRAHARDLKARIDAASRAETAKIGTSITAEDRIHDAAQAGTRATTAGTSGTTAAVNRNTSTLAGVIAASQPIVNVTTNVAVTASGIQKSTTTSSRYGNQNGSAAGGSGGSAHNKYD